ncbi:hypothetical protein KXX24_004427 [Aspergillus fumigatus]|nr:hypothetical protein KXX45_000712 [Aspergillus fumigatus]KAH1707232.1 hypothetical protein KXX24_004427 [Aspergillus fumigatus]KAH2838636.1 hypothetical protein KXW08_000501 [Aspergillus fumigatus]OXN09409.1 hypothetical protein CDV58_02345 [Aspergillus fumigatus]
MATELTVQSERAFQKQPHIFLNSKTKAKSKKVGQTRRWYKDVGLGFRTPKTAIEGSYIGYDYLGLRNEETAEYKKAITRIMAQKIWEEKAERDDCATGFVPKSSTVAFIAEFGIPHLQNPGIESYKKCPFTGMVSIRGRILTGRVVSTKMHRTIIIRREYLHYVPKYNRYEKRHKNLAAHVSPAFRVEEGDWVTVGQCRPLSKTVRFNVLRVLPRTGKAVKAFNKF